ncbi:MAG: FKBP-type peptidyl-prolyl cis-trans isomerase [Candidatus Undinarchaeales archaeon]
MGKIKNGDFIQLEYTGRIKDSGKIFDLTDEKTAKKEDVYDENTEYGPVTIVVGAGHLLSGLEEKIVGSEIGKEEKITISPEKGFGKRDSDKIELVPRSIFKRKNIKPAPGMPVKVKNKQGIVQSVSGGRIRVDFNHPLAGKELEYEIKPLKKITDIKKQVKSLLDLHLGRADLSNVKIDIKGKEVKIESPDNKRTRRFINLTKDIVAKDILKYINKLDKVKFVDVITREKKASKDEKSKKSKSKSKSKKKKSKK